jgi:FlaA1/EpsC-like NDP-sugar epimerase
MPRTLLSSLRTALDLLVLSIAYWLAFLFRFEFTLPRLALHVLLINWAWVIAVYYLGLSAFRVQRLAWRYIGMRDAVQVLAAIAAATLVLLGCRLAIASTFPHAAKLPLGVIAMSAVLAFVGILGVRAAWRMRGEAVARRKRLVEGDRERVLLIGAGEAGVLVAKELSNRPDLGLHAVGFIDDDPMKTGTKIAGLSVLGTMEDVAAIAARKRVRRVLITIANASGQTIRRINEICRASELRVQIIPGVYEIVAGTVNLSRFREVAIEDLLGREPVELDQEIVGASIGSRVVLVTGAGGSIGSELCRVICRFGPQRLVLVERFENALFEIHRELTATFPHLSIEPCIGDVCDAARMTKIFETTKPQLVFHAAAHKHVPMMEWNPGEAVKNNVGGTRVVADLADRFAVERFVLISTDKAVNPTSIMGATKRVAEIYLQGLSQRSSTRFVAVRFGNVLGSAGSVVPIFRQQIERGGPVTVTHPEMTRYFMTIPEASQLVLQAGAMGTGGEIFILDMGEPVKILDLARDLIRLSGLDPDTDIEIQFSGIRPGEKLREELAADSEHADKTKHPKIQIGKIKCHEWSAVDAAVSALLDIANAGDSDAIRSSLAALVPEFRAERPRRPTHVARKLEQHHQEIAPLPEPN